MRFPKAFYLLFCLALLLGMMPLSAAAREAAPIDPELVTRLAAEGTANFFVKMAVEADLSAAYAMDWDARGKYVWRVLNEVAQATQAPVIAYCQELGLTCRSFVTTNAVLLRAGTADQAQDLARLPGVAYLRLERRMGRPGALAKLEETR